MPRRLLIALWAACATSAAAPALALDEGREDVRAFVNEMSVRHGFAIDELERLFARAESRPSIVAAMSRPAEKSKPWHEYRAIFLTDRRISRGAETARRHAEELAAAAARGVPPEVILAITGVETMYGENTGRYRVVDALATLAFDYPRRSSFFRGELEQFLLMSREEALDPLVPTGSYAGAMGIPQFMPSSFRSYAVDGDDDGHRNLWVSWADVFASIANYLLRHGWRSGEPVMVPADASGADLAGLEFGTLDLTSTVASLRGRGVHFETTLQGDAPAVLLRLEGHDGPEYRVGFSNFYTITRYNRSQLYASAVSDLAEAIAVATRPAPPELAPDDPPTTAAP